MLEQGDEAEGEEGLEHPHPRLPLTPRLEAAPDAEASPTPPVPPGAVHRGRRDRLRPVRRQRHNRRRLPANETTLHRRRNQSRIRTDRNEPPENTRTRTSTRSKASGG